MLAVDTKYLEKKLTHELAMKILDKVKEGVAYPRMVVERALMMTGDIDELLTQSTGQLRGQEPT